MQFGRWLEPKLYAAGLFVIAVLLGATTSGAAQAGMSWIVVDGKSGRVLQEHGADKRRYPASLTKMMTLYLAFEALRAGTASAHKRFRVSRHAASRQPTKLGLRPGQKVPLRQLILALITQSANDAAVVIAEGLSRTERAFARRMTRQARKLGMTSTVFRNASGLPDRRQHTTARDMARLARALLRDFPARYDHFSTRRFSFRGRTYVNHNRLLRDYPGADGIKTGYTRASGFNLVASAVRQGRRLIAVVLGGASAAARDRHTVKLLDAAFDSLPAQESIRRAALPIDSSPAAAVTSANVISPATTNAPANAASPASSAAGPSPPSHIDPFAALPADPAEWSIQVGAFSHREMAEKRASQAVLKDFDTLAGHQRIVEVKSSDGEALFAVRFANLTAEDATGVCRTLRNEDRECLVLAPRP